MPYRLDGSDAPENVQKLPRKKKRQWIRIWNSVWQKCKDSGGKECEKMAFKMANGSVKPQ